MLFSCKISHSIVSFLERKSEDLEYLYEAIEVPSEFLKDPSYWIDAQTMEAFLRQAEDRFGNSATVNSNEPLLTGIGRQAHRLRSWGTLDSVLRIMQKVQDVYLQPARFISYFVAPEPPIGNLVREPERVEFDLPISSDEFPKVTEYLAAALEGLPHFLGQEPAQVKWNGIKISIGWAEAEALPLGDEITRRNFKPELVDSVMASLEASQRELEAKNKELFLKTQLIEELQKKTGDTCLSQDLRPAVLTLLNDVQRLQDYMVRAGQVITLLIGKDRLTPQVKEAMRRTDWDYVKTQFPSVAQEMISRLNKIQDVVKGSAQSESLRDEPLKAAAASRSQAHIAQSDLTLT